MFASSYKTVDQERKLSRLGVLGMGISFLLLSLMIHWHLVYTGASFGPISEFLLWTAPAIFAFGLSAIYYLLMNWRQTKRRQSYGVTFYWTVMSLLPAATLVSLAEYLAVATIPTAFVHSLGLLGSVGIFGLLWLSSRNMAKHSRILTLTLGFYVLAVLVQLWLLAA